MPNFVEKIEEQKMAFEGDFEKVDSGLKAQLKAIVNDDMETLNKLRNLEMSNHDIQMYVADPKMKR